MNEEIRVPEIRVVDSDGGQLGIMKTADALELSLKKQLDLVMIAPQAAPPVCKFMDYSKHKFEQAKKEKEIRKNQKITVVKEVRMSPTIDEHDIQTKVANITKFLKAGDKVKITIRFRGREIAHASLGEKVLIRISEMVAEFGTVEKRPKLEGRNMSIFVNPVTHK